MEKKYLNPDTLLKPRGYTHIVTITGPAKMIFIDILCRELTFAQLRQPCQRIGRP